MYCAHTQTHTNDSEGRTVIFVNRLAADLYNFTDMTCLLPERLLTSVTSRHAEVGDLKDIAYGNIQLLEKHPPGLVLMN